ncbi:MAG: hypothetical protein K2O84_10215 [Oscillospiraceae bacterium]|nr:hypothetical protein [Oscillospiraceae bacterium]
MYSIIYMILATGMFFFQDTYFSVGEMELSLKNPCALAILFLALLNFVVTVRLDRLLVLARHTAVQSLPYLVPLVFSSIIWVSVRAEGAIVVNGISMILPQMLSVLVAAATVYLFGGKGIWYCLGAMCAANFLSVLVVIYTGGLDLFLQEFYTLLITFSKETGPLMMQLETHDLTFAFGPFLLYLLLHWKTSPHSGLWLLLATFFSLVGLKRIAFPALALAILAAILLRQLPERAAKQTALCVAAAMMIFSFLYIAGIRFGLFEYLDTHLGLDTKGRAELFANVAPYYDISFTYMGRGTGFERMVEWFSGVEYALPLRTQTQIHNDFLRMYLNIGFVGYWVWLWSWLPARLGYWFRQGGKDTGCLFLGICIYCFVLYATDNTIYYPYTMTACALVPMTCRFNAQAKAALERRCAQWSGENEPVSNGAPGF